MRFVTKKQEYKMKFCREQNNLGIYVIKNFKVT